MHPVLFEFGPLTLYTYGVTLVIACAAAVGLAARAATRLPEELRAISAAQLVDFASFALLGGLVGGRLFFVALHRDFFLSAPMEVFAIWHGGLVWYGGFLGGALAGWTYLRAQGLPFLRVADQFIPYLALGHAIGRVGCFLNGCCYGTPTDAWCGVRFPGTYEAVLPTQLFEALGLVLIAKLLTVLQQPARLREPGRVFGWYLVTYALLRTVMESLRGDQSPWWMGVTLQQLISLLVLGLGIVLLVRRVRRAA